MRMTHHEIRYMLLLSVFSIGWMTGFIWIVVAGTTKYMSYMYEIDSSPDAIRQVPLTNESTAVSPNASTIEVTNRTTLREKSRFDDYPSLYDFSVTDDHSCNFNPQDINFHSQNWKRMCDCARVDS